MSTRERTLMALACAAFCLLAGSARAQEAFTPPSTEGWTRAPGTQRQSEFPKVNADGEYWFRFRAPATARDVKLNFGGIDFPALQDSEGYWNVVTKAPKVGFMITYLVIDGVRYMDPGAEASYVNGWVGYVEVPSPKDDYYLIRDVPHGEVREHWFYSEVEKNWRRAYVYTPAEYETEFTKRYPVLYLQHGAGENEAEWTHAGFAAIIADNLIAEGRLEPLIIVMNNDFVYRPGDSRGRLALAPDWAGNFEEMLLKESIPDIESHYRVIADAEHRAMAGLSLGGMLTNAVGIKHSDLFSYYGIFSGGVVSDPSLVRRDVVKHIFITAGSQENPQRVVDNVEMLNGMGIKASSYVSPDTAHEWQTWRRSLHEFLQIIFK